MRPFAGETDRTRGARPARGAERARETGRTRGPRRTRGAGRARRAGAALAGAAALLTAAACGVGSSDAESVADMEKLVIGVNGDRPGVGLRIAESGDYDAFEGFDVRVAKEIARNLGVNAADVSFREVTSGNRETLLANGDVDLVVAGYSITPERKLKAAFAGPYYVAHQDLMVREADADAIRSIHDLVGKRVCRVEGSTSFPRIHDEQGVAAVPVDAGGYGECLRLLTEGRLDAVSTDDLILAGLARQAAADGHTMTIVNAPISDERYSVGLRADDVEGCEAVNEAITKMYLDDTIPIHLERWFGETELELSKDVPQFEGCQ
ncbi:glutamate ABC transporter substrate-binding protein [Actinomadura sp. WMMB 499]|uniref:glutamate ABC transporter substrate-binding protein n=1 Tax=Actinomadura sp. WMMB 499 TaxID=1219491 RepID=UPI0012463888|nr:glutamate ABC transporter substrate-binding protein [Actinomadura sp. WMMB 499]QFG25499.1 glutamate ABC transporter substrate-binding protein [Actinomadura sp. WMMB 499]